MGGCLEWAPGKEMGVNLDDLHTVTKEPLWMEKAS